VNAPIKREARRGKQTRNRCPAGEKRLLTGCKHAGTTGNVSDPFRAGVAPCRLPPYLSNPPLVSREKQKQLGNFAQAQNWKPYQLIHRWHA
jgi:hypothetical protein